MLVTLSLWAITEWIPNIIVNLGVIIDTFKEVFFIV